MRVTAKAVNGHFAVSVVDTGPACDRGASLALLSFEKHNLVAQ